MEQCREVIRYRRLSRCTENAYLHWIRRFIVWTWKRHPKEMGATDVRPRRGAWISRPGHLRRLALNQHRPRAQHHGPVLRAGGGLPERLADQGVLGEHWDLEPRAIANGPVERGVRRLCHSAGKCCWIIGTK